MENVERRNPPKDFHQQIVAKIDQVAADDGIRDETVLWAAKQLDTYAFGTSYPDILSDLSLNDLLRLNPLEYSPDLKITKERLEKKLPVTITHKQIVLDA